MSLNAIIVNIPIVMIDSVYSVLDVERTQCMQYARRVANVGKKALFNTWKPDIYIHKN